MTRPPALPLPVPFPVYGLPTEYAGPRHIVMWNQPDFLWTVTLTHGSFSAERGLTVDTLRRLPRPQQDHEEFAPRPVGLDLAALNALTHAIDRAPRRGKPKDHVETLMNSELALVEMHEDDVIYLRDWSPITIEVDGEQVPALAREIDGAQAIVVDLPDVVLSLVATGDFDTNSLVLVDVRDHLADYPWPSVREHMRARRSPPPLPQQENLHALHLGLSDILANAKDETMDSRELLARVEHVADHLLHTVLTKVDRTANPHERALPDAANPIRANRVPVLRDDTVERLRRDGQPCSHAALWACGTLRCLRMRTGSIAGLWRA